MGYDVSEVVSFLADVEHTITGAQTDPEKVITAQKATDVEFTVRLRGCCATLMTSVRSAAVTVSMVLACLTPVSLSSPPILNRWRCPTSMPISVPPRLSIRFFVP